MNDFSNSLINGPNHTVLFGPKAHSQEIDSLRGIAAFLIFLFHSEGIISKNPEKLSGIADLLQAFVVTGATGVTIFFMISGFLLSIPFFKNPKPDRILFYKKRLIRIIPIYWLIVTVAGIVTGVLFNDPLKALRSYLFIFDGWELYPFSIPWWTLRTEMQFYLILPLLMPLVHFRKGRWAIIAMVPLYVLVMFAGIHLLMNSVTYYYFMQSVIGHAPTFVIGIVMAWLYLTYGPTIKAYFNNKMVFKYGLSDAIIILTFFVLSLVLREVSLRGGTFAAETNWPQRYLYESVLWSIIFIGVILLPMRLKPLLSNRFLAKYGEISYPFYLVHLPVLYCVSNYLSFFKKGWNLLALGGIALCFIIAFIIAYIINAFIEKPILNYKNNL